MFRIRMGGPAQPARVLTAFFVLLTGTADAAQTAPGDQRPIPYGEGTELYERVITLPGAKLYEAPDIGSRVHEPELPVFDVFYVFDRAEQGNERWLEVGRQGVGPPDGWLPAKQVQDWSIMLVMQYEPPGQRERVLFFEERETLQDLVLEPDVADQSRDLLAQVDAETHAGSGLIAVENEDYVSFESSPYLMPVLDWAYEVFDDGTPSILLQVAGLTAGISAEDDRSVESLRQARRAIVFVIDTTLSMGPYIEQARAIAQRIYDELGRSGQLQRISFGLVGYRNNMDREPQRSRLEYVSRVFVDLDPEAPPERLLDGLEAMTPANVSTHSWDEDAVAGMYDAIWKMDWTPFEELRLVILITDAGALGGNDPRARHQDERLGLWNVGQKAIQERITVVPIHLLTPEAQQARNVESARQQYQQVSYTGDPNVSKYLYIPAGSVQAFGNQLDQLADQMAGVIRRSEQGIPESRPVLEQFEGGITLGSLFRNEVYSAQQRYLGELSGEQATTFYRAWATDRDLTNPGNTALRVSVFLTRNQFNDLAQRLGELVRRAEHAEESPQTFFARLQALALKTSTDPLVSVDRLSNTDLLPAYLDLLPYKSKVLNLTQEDWHSRSPTQQRQFLVELGEKLRAYEEYNADQRKWRDLGATDPGLQVFPVPLELLP